MTGLTAKQNVLLNNYNGFLALKYRHDVKKDENGNVLLDDVGAAILNSPDLILETIDTRDLEMEKLKHIKQTWLDLNVRTLELAPAYIQNNAALGILSLAETRDIVELIKAVKNELALKKASINAATTPDEVIMAAKTPDSKELTAAIAAFGE